MFWRCSKITPKCRKGSILVNHCEPDKVLLAHGKIFKSTANINEILDNIIDHSTQTLTINIKDKVKLKLKPPKKMLFKAEEIVRYYSAERDRLVKEYNKSVSESEKIKPESLKPLYKDNEKEIITQEAKEAAQEWRKRYLRYRLLSKEEKSVEFKNLLNRKKFIGLSKQLKGLGVEEKIIFKEFINEQIDGANFMIMAAFNKKPLKLIKLLKELGGDINQPDKNGRTAAHYCATTQDVNTIMELQKLGLDINVKDNKGHGAIFCSGSTEVTEYLISQGADINSKNNEGKSLLRIYLESEHLTPKKKVEFITCFLKNGAIIYEDREILEHPIFADARLLYVRDLLNLSDKMSKQLDSKKSSISLPMPNTKQEFLKNTIIDDPKSFKTRGVTSSF